MKRIECRKQNKTKWVCVNDQLIVCLSRFEIVWWNSNQRFQSEQKPIKTMRSCRFLALMDWHDHMIFEWECLWPNEILRTRIRMRVEDKHHICLVIPEDSEASDMMREHEKQMRKWVIKKEKEMNREIENTLNKQCHTASHNPNDDLFFRFDHHNPNNTKSTNKHKSRRRKWRRKKRRQIERQSISLHFLSTFLFLFFLDFSHIFITRRSKWIYPTDYHPWWWMNIIDNVNRKSNHKKSHFKISRKTKEKKIKRKEWMIEQKGTQIAWEWIWWFLFLNIVRCGKCNF